GQQAEYVLAVPPAQEAAALAVAVLRLADADVVQRPKPSAVHGEAAPADLAGDLDERVHRLLALHRDADDAHAVYNRGANEPDDAFLGFHATTTGTPSASRQGTHRQYTGCLPDVASSRRPRRV